jgi:hypothetical protein
MPEPTASTADAAGVHTGRQHITTRQMPARAKRHDRPHTLDPVIDVTDVTGLYEPDPAAAAARATHCLDGSILRHDD